MNAKKTVTVCAGCGGKDHHVILKGGVTDEHRRSHEKRGRRLDTREMSVAEAERFLAVAAKRLAPEEQSIAMKEAYRNVRAERHAAEKAAAAQRKAERLVAAETAHEKREAKRAAEAAAKPAMTEVVADPHAGCKFCECGRWVVAEHMAAHLRHDRHIDDLRRKRAAERNTEARREVVVEIMAEEAAEQYVASLSIPDQLEVEMPDGDDAEEISAEEMENLLAEDEDPKPTPEEQEEDAESFFRFLKKFFGRK